MSKKKSFKILIDIHEMDSALYSKLISFLKDDEWEMKEGNGYDACADYIIIDRKGNTWGIERKSFLDCYHSILDNRIYGQLAELHGKFPKRAIFLLEAPAYFPNKLKNRRYQILKAVYTFFNERSMSMPCWVINDSEHGANFIIKFAKNAHNISIEGRNVKVIVDY